MSYSNNSTGTWSPTVVVQDGKRYLVDQDTGLVYSDNPQWPEVVGALEGGQVRLRKRSTAGDLHAHCKRQGCPEIMHASNCTPNQSVGADPGCTHG
jgi:hypothetical protein